MLVDNSVYRNSYVANGSTTKFAISFPFLDNAHIIVYKNVNGTESVVNSSEYTITGAGQQNGGTLTFGSAPSSGTIIVIARNVPITQLHKYTELDNFPAESHEDALAKLTMIDQQQQDSINRAIKLAETDTRTPDELLNEIFTAKDVAVACATESCQCADNADTSRNEALQFRNEAQSILNNTVSAGNTAVANVQAQEASSIQAVKGQEATSVAVVEAEGDTQAVRLVDLANNILVSGTAYNKEVTADITVETPANTYITLPVDSKGDQLMYRVGASMIRMSYNGAQMYLGDQFDEVGIAGSISTQIKVNFDLEVGSRLNFFVISQNVTVIVDESSGLSIDEHNRLTAKPLKAIADAAVKTVNGNAPDSAGNATVDVGVKTVNDNAPDSNGNITPAQTGCLPLTGGTVTGKVKVASPGFIEGGEIRLLEDEKENVTIDRANNLLRFFGSASKKVISFDPSTGVLHCPYTIDGVATSAYSVKSDAIAYGRATTGFTLPNGGTWFVFASMDNMDGSTFACPTPVVVAGGTYIGWDPHSGQTSYSWMAIKIF